MSQWEEELNIENVVYGPDGLVTFHIAPSWSVRSSAPRATALGREYFNGILACNSENEYILTTVDDIPVRTLFMNGISIHTKWMDVFNACSEFGEINKIYLKANIPKPFAFVTFVSPVSAFMALRTRWINILDTNVRVTIADSWHQPTEMPDGTVMWSKHKNKDTERGQDEENQEEDNAEYVMEKIVTSEGTVSMNILNDDCLSHVFSFLGLIDRLELDRVCKRWQAVNALLWHRVRVLDFTDPLMSCIPVNHKSLECFLKKCRRVKIINLCVEEHTLGAKAIVLIAKFCSEVEEIYLLGLRINKRCLPHFAKYCTKLRKIMFKDCDEFSDKDLSSWFGNANNLTSVTLGRARNFNGSSLSTLNTPLEHLALNDCYNLTGSNLLKFLLKHGSSLKHLSLNSCISLESLDVFRIACKAPNLTSLSLANRFPFFRDGALYPIIKLQYLRELNLSQNANVFNGVLNRIVNGCPELVKVNLSGCGSISSLPDLQFTTGGLIMLKKLKKLTMLNISYLLQTNDICLRSLSVQSSLKVLKCIGCPRVSDYGCCQVLTFCNELEEFDISGNRSITDITVTTALKSVNLCANRKPLTLFVGGTNVGIQDSNDKRLIISFVNNCIFNLTLDVVDQLLIRARDNGIDNDYSGDDKRVPDLEGSDNSDDDENHSYEMFLRMVERVNAVPRLNAVPYER